MHLDLDALTESSGTVTVFGKKRPVMPIDGNGFRFFAMLVKAKAEGTEDDVIVKNLPEFTKLCHRLVPSLTAAQAESLNIKQMMGIVGVASDNVTVVEAMFPNGLPGGQSPAKKKKTKSRTTAPSA